MDKKTWEAFRRARDHFREYAEKLDRETPGLRAWQQELADSRDGPPYTVETPVLYNFRLDEVRPADDVQLILVADNPGRREQAAENRRYLVGPSGKLAGRFFREHPELGIDFDRQVIILNKTPVHSPRTGELRELCRRGGAGVTEAIAGSQRIMAELLVEFHRVFRVPVWITGYSEMHPRGIFAVYTAALGERYRRNDAETETLRDRLFLYRHFSMNQFTIDLNRQRRSGENLASALERIGRAYRGRILGW
jgi:hypothetical protein